MKSWMRGIVTAFVMLAVMTIGRQARALPGQAEYEDATINYLDALSSFMVAYETSLAEGEEPAFDYNSEPTAVAAKAAYIAAMTFSLNFIDTAQAQGIAHYNPAYLAEAHALLNQIQAGWADDYNGAHQFRFDVNDFGNLYNAGTYRNFFEVMQMRQITGGANRYIRANPRYFASNGGAVVAGTAGTGTITSYIAFPGTPDPLGGFIGDENEGKTPDDCVFPSFPGTPDPLGGFIGDENEGKTPDDCANICSSTSGCVGFYHVTDQARCRMYSVDAQVASTEGPWSNLVMYWSPLAVRYTASRSADPLSEFLGDEFAQHDANQCAQECDARAECVGFYHVFDQARCRLYTNDAKTAATEGPWTNLIMYWKTDLSAVTIYADNGYSGRSQTLKPGRYDIGALTVGNDAISSIQVPPGWTVTLYADAGFSGRSKTVSWNTPLLNDFSDLTSSIVVTGP